MKKYLLTILLLVAIPASVLAAPFLPTQGGTGNDTYTIGDILYASASKVLTKLGIGSEGECLTVVSGVPSWATCSGGGGGGSTTTETPGGAVNSVNTSFTVTAEPLWVVSDGTAYFDGYGYTYSPLAIAMDIPPSQYIRATVSTALSIETPTGSVNSVNDTFTVTTEPLWIIADGVTYYDGDGYTYAGLTVTMDTPPSQYIRSIY